MSTLRIMGISSHVCGLEIKKKNLQTTPPNPSFFAGLPVILRVYKSNKNFPDSFPGETICFTPGKC